uniref:Uncharacterized protein n=1 Tax=Octopus bimaculoides TaxID=37653 RepID=A0A0L8GGR9_OCTBM
MMVVHISPEDVSPYMFKLDINCFDLTHETDPEEVKGHESQLLIILLIHLHSSVCVVGGRSRNFGQPF